MIDVAVIGGGPAGASAAIACARAGLRAVVFEREQADDESGGPAESVGPDCVALLQDLGVLNGVLAVPFAGVMVGRSVTMFGSAAGRFAGMHIARRSLDEALRRVAVREGVQLRSGVEVRGLEADGTFHLRTSAGPAVARMVIDASGRRACLAHQLALGRRRLSPPLIAWRDTITTPQACTGAFARFIPCADGWTWLAETEARSVVRVRLAAARGRATKLPPGAMAHGVTWYLVQRLAGPGWFIAGDAASALDPAAGSGIVTALRTGLAAGAAAIAASAEPVRAPFVAARYHDAVSRAAENCAAVLASSYRRLGITALGQRGLGTGAQPIH